MQTEAIFNNISYRIKQEISQATDSIYVAVAWFTNKSLFQELVGKAKDGCKVSLVISDDAINQNSYNNFNELCIGDSKVYKVGNGDTNLMHNKFCIIDGKNVITGSYNWSYKAETNFENVVITYDDTTLAEQFITEFRNIIKKYYSEDVPEQKDIPYEKVFKRLEILKNYILLEDIEEAQNVSLKLKEYEYNREIKTIITSIKNKEFAIVLTKIQEFISSGQQITLFNDPEIFALKLEIKVLENQINAFDNEKTDLEKLLAEYHYRHTKELSEVILNLLNFKKQKLKYDKEAYGQAESDEQTYKGAIEDEIDKQLFELDVEQRVELKKNFRRASILCHPDKVSDEFREMAQEIFIDLKKAYDENDLKKVNEISSELEKGRYFKPKSETINEKDLLRVAIAQLKRKIRLLENEIIEIKESETYKTISFIDDWDQHFEVLKITLNQELEELKSELNILSK